MKRLRHEGTTDLLYEKHGLLGGPGAGGEVIKNGFSHLGPPLQGAHLIVPQLHTFTFHN